MIKQVFTILLSTLFLLQINAYAEDPAPPTPVARVIWVKGSLRALMTNNEERSLQKMSIIYLHDTLTTDDKSQAQIAFTDNTLMTFRPSTKFVVDEYSFKPETKKGSVGKYIMRLIEGGFRTITGIIAKRNPADYRVNTPVATIGVRGTDYTVALGKKGELLIGFYAGSPCVNNKMGSLCLSEANRYAKVSLNSAPVPLAEQPAEFREKLDILPTKISPFSSVGGGGGTVSRSGGYTAPAPAKMSGTMTSFCISQ